MPLVDPLHLSVLALLGAALGFAGGMFGIGGGIIAIPMLTMVFGQDQATAQGTALVMMTPNLLIAWWRYMRHNPVPMAEVAGIAIGGGIATWGAAQLAHWLDQSLLRSIFAVFLLILAARMSGLLRRDAHAQAQAPAAILTDRRLLPLVGSAGGLSMGLLGVGGGLVSTPLFSRLFGMGQRMAQSLGLALVTPCSVVALGTYAGHHHVNWLLGTPLAAGGMLTVAAGVSVAHRLPEAVLRRAFAVMLALTGAWMLVQPLVRG